MKDHDGVRALREAGIPVIGDDAELTRPAEVAWAGIPKLPDAEEDRRALLEASLAGPDDEPTIAQQIAWAGVPKIEDDGEVRAVRRLREHDLDRPRGWFVTPVGPEDITPLREAAGRQMRALSEGRSLREVLAA